MNKVIEETIQTDHFNLHLIPSKKYKTITIVAKFKAPLNRDNITKRVLVPSILRQGTKNYPTREDLQYKLDDLYGASLSLDSGKAGGNHVMSIRMEVANQKYIDNESSIMDESISLLHEVIFNPHVIDNGFNPKVVKREKETLNQQIASIVDDKDSFAQMRLVDHMCKGENYQIHAHGYQEDLEEITPKNLYEYYQTLLSNDVLDIYILGDFDHDVVAKTAKEIIVRDHQRPSESEGETSNEIITEVNQVNEIIEYQDVQQAKLHLGYRTGITYKDDDYAALLIFNGIFGGYPGSKLFLNVREKHSLAYYVGSGAESYNGLMFVTSGIAGKDFDKARNIIDEQLQAMKNGDFDNEQVEEIKRLMVSQLIEAMDDAQGLIELLYRNVLGGRDRSLEALINEIKQVKRDAIIAIANKLKLDTVYLLTSKEDA